MIYLIIVKLLILLLLSCIFRSIRQIFIYDKINKLYNKEHDRYTSISGVIYEYLSTSKEFAKISNQDLLMKYFDVTLSDDVTIDSNNNYTSYLKELCVSYKSKSDKLYESFKDIVPEFRQKERDKKINSLNILHHTTNQLMF